MRAARVEWVLLLTVAAALAATGCGDDEASATDGGAAGASGDAGDGDGSGGMTGTVFVRP